MASKFDAHAVGDETNCLESRSDMPTEPSAAPVDAQMEQCPWVDLDLEEACEQLDCMVATDRYDEAYEELLKHAQPFDDDKVEPDGHNSP